MKIIDAIVSRSLVLLLTLAVATIGVIAYFTFVKSNRIYAPNKHNTRSIRADLLDKVYNGYTFNKKAKYSYLLRLHNEEGNFFCTGFVINKYYAITAAHCVTDRMSTDGMTKEDIIIKSSLSENTDTTARAAAIGGRTDIAVLRGDFSKFNNVRIAANKVDINPKKEYVACGYPLGQKKVFCSKLKILGNQIFAIKAEGYLYPGMSGGPVLDKHHNIVIGVNSYATEYNVAFYPMVGILEALGVIR